MTVSLASLVIQETKEAIYRYGLSIAEAVGLPVTAWQAGDPSRSLFHLESELLATLESVVVGFIGSGFLDFAAARAKAEPSDPRSSLWLKVIAEQVFNVEVPEATRATTTVVLTNNGGGLYDDIDVGSITVKNSSTGKTYRNTTVGTLASGPGTTLSLTFEADDLGSESSAGPDEIDELVTGMLGVTCSNPLAAVGIDEQDPDTTVQQCRDKLGSLSPNGPKEANSYVARNADLTGTNAVTRVRVYGDTETGDVTVYLAGPSGGVAEADRALVEDAIVLWATPICNTPTVLAASNVPIAVTYEAWVYKSSNRTADELAEEIESALETMFANRPIGGDIIPPSLTGILSHSMIESTIRGVSPQIFKVVLSSPSSDTSIANGQVATLSTVTPTVNIVVDP